MGSTATARFWCTLSLPRIYSFKLFSGAAVKEVRNFSHEFQPQGHKYYGVYILRRFWGIGAILFVGFRSYALGLGIYNRKRYLKRTKFIENHKSALRPSI